MGESRQRKLAKESGRPWERDAPKAPEPLPWYMDPMCPDPPPRQGPAVQLVRDPMDDHTQIEHLERARQITKLAEQKGVKVLVIGDDPRDPLPRPSRRQNVNLLLAALASLSMGGGQ